MLPRLLALICPFLFFTQSANEQKAKPYEVTDAYSVYSAVLAQEKTTGRILINETTVPFNECLEPSFNKQVNSAIQDYKRANQSIFALQHKFNLKRDYQLLSANERKRLRQNGSPNIFGWTLPEAKSIYSFSAVGFSPDKTIAFLEMDVVCGGMCGHGSPLVLQKRKGRWMEFRVPPKQNSDRRYQFTASCSWNY